MKWKKFSEEVPELRKDLLLGWIESGSFIYRFGYVNRPFDSNKKFNPDYYEYISFQTCTGERKESPIEKELFWMVIERPDGIPEISF